MRLTSWTSPSCRLPGRCDSVRNRVPPRPAYRADYFLGGRTAPWWALGISIVATETSTLTIIGTPALAFAGNITFLQLVLGYLRAGHHRAVISAALLPWGILYGLPTDGKEVWCKSKAVAASTFLVTRALAEGVRIAASRLS